jgi:hypothetical protein
VEPRGEMLNDLATWRRTTLALTWATSLVLVSVLGTRAAPPPPSSRTQLTFQARLTSPNGQPLSGEFALTFRIYDDSTGLVPLWSEVHDGTALPRPRIVNGILSVVLGQTLPLDGAVFDPGGTGERYVAVELAGEELCRVKLTATAYAVAATVANTLWDPRTSTVVDAQTLDDRYVDSAEVEAFVPPATTDVAGKVILAAHDATTAGAAVQGSDPRLAGVRVRANNGTPTSRRAQVNLIAGPNLTISAVDDPGNNEVDVTVAATAAPSFMELEESSSGHTKTVTVPGGTLAVDGEALHIWASGEAAGGQNLRIRWNGVPLIPTLVGGFEGLQTWVITGYLIRTSSTTVIGTFHVTVCGFENDVGGQIEEWVQPRIQVSGNLSQPHDVTVDYEFPTSPGTFGGSEVNVLRVRKER